MADVSHVLVIPGFAASDRSTQVIRASLAAQGHRVHGWRLGRNEGPTERATVGLRRRLGDLADRVGTPVALVGWSLGGVYSHWLTRAAPGLVRSVVTLGSPLARDGSPPATLPVPTTSVYSRNDRVVAWQASILDDSADRHENVEVRAGHIGLGFDPAVLYLIADRVRCRPDAWRPFQAPRWLALAFPRAARPVS